MTRQILLSMALLSTGICLAAPLTPEEALSRLDIDGLTSNTRSVLSLKPVLTLSTKIGEPSLYVFDTKDTPGFMVVSADDAVAPLLGYSDYNNLDPDNLPPSMQAWLGQYSRQIEYLRENPAVSTRGDVSTRVSLPNWSSVAPLVKTTWNQESPYNLLCPTVNNTSTPTGCVATSMAQVMKYFNYPEKGQGKISYDIDYGTDERPNYVTYSLDFSTITFDWSNMINSYSNGYSQVQADAVATLMQAAGYSVQMTYAPNLSGAISGFIPGALIHYFGYDSSAVYISRSMCNYTEWATLIYENLKNYGPVIYDGDTQSSGGHSFVCDGYDKDGYFHFNWGWGGAGDGYFLLDSLEPAVIGTGGALGGFNYAQDAVFKIQKPTSNSQPALEQIVLNGSVYGKAVSGGSFLQMGITGAYQTGFRYYGDDEMTFEVGLAFTPADNPNSAPIYKSSPNSIYQLTPGYLILCDAANNRFPLFPVSGLGISDNVKYKATAVYKREGSDNWQEMAAAYGSYNYFYITKKGNTITAANIENLDQLQLTCNNLSLGSTLYNKKAVEADITVTNESNGELTRGITLVLLNDYDQVAFMGDDSIVKTFSEGESYTTKLTTWLSQQPYVNVKVPGQFYIGLMDIDTYTVYYKSETPVTMQADPGNPTFSEMSITIENAETVPNDNPISDDDEVIYVVENAQDIIAKVTIGVSKGIYAAPGAVYVAKLSSGRFSVVQQYPLDLEIIEEGEVKESTLNINFSGAEVEKVYYLLLDLATNENINNTLIIDTGISFMALTNDSGVESIIAGEGEIVMRHDKIGGKLNVIGGNSQIKSVDIYSLNGMKLSVPVDYSGPDAVVDLSTLGKGVVMVTATDSKGHRKSVKLAL